MISSPLLRNRLGWRWTQTLFLLLAGVLLASVGPVKAQVRTTPPLTASVAVAAEAPSATQQARDFSPLATGQPPVIPAAWRSAQLPDSRIPRGVLKAVNLDGETALQLQTDRSYGTLVHEWQGPVPGWLKWQWRLDQPLAQSDLRQRSGDDAALKVCAFFNQPLADIPLLERATLRLARAASGEALPAATLCYVWDAKYAAGTSGANPYSARVRYIVLQGPAAPLGQWVTEQRDLARDFNALFGQESPQWPPLIGLAVGADSDNTQGKSMGYLRQLGWLNAPR